MTLMLSAFILLSVLELLLVSSWLTPVRRPLAAAEAVALALVSGGILGSRFSVATVLFAVISLYRVVGLLRIVQNRAHIQYLRRAVRLTTASLFILQIAILVGISFADAVQPSSDLGWLILSGFQLAVAALLYLSTRRHLRTTRPLDVSEHFSDSQLPALSVCIPARNETAELEQCLKSLTASTYPKLEIIVLDDCSQSTRTSDIIRSFAHDGVRFIKGDVPPDNWLAKNWAYQKLLEASSGQLVLFCGVDMQFEPATLKTLVTTMLAKEKRMASVIPRNILPTAVRDQLSVLIQPARYMWELCLPRRMFKRPPVLSSCWIAERKLIEHAGAFTAVKSTITPEAHFARKALLRDGYSFVQAPGEFGMTSRKSIADQWETSVRVRYPQLRRRPEMVFIVTGLELAALIAPPIVMVIGIAQGMWLQAFLSGLATILLLASYSLVVTLTYRQFLWRSFILEPFAVLLDAYLRHESLWRYEFGEIEWKGRNICLPVMRVIPRFPKA